MIAEPTQPENLTEKDLHNLLDSWSFKNREDRFKLWQQFSRLEEEELFLRLSAKDQAELLLMLNAPERRSWLRLLALDDVADLIQALPYRERHAALILLDEHSRIEVVALMAYAEDKAGGLMNSRYFRLRPNMSTDEALRYIKAQASALIEAVYYAYVIDEDQTLLGVLSFRNLLLAKPDAKIADIMQKNFVSVHEDLDQEEVSRRLSLHHLSALPVVDEFNRIKGIVTVKDIVDVVREEATEDIQKLGGTSVLTKPYLKTSILEMIRKRALWLVILFVGEMLTATAMAYYEQSIAKAVVLALFIPLIISSGGNSGSQASTLIIRALALKETHLRDWWRVFIREIIAGVCLGLILGSIGFMRIMLWPARERVYGEHYVLVAITVATSLVAVVLWGALAGAMLPFILKRLHIDPATASAPMVATIVDVTGLVLYFSIASIYLSGILL